MIANTGVDGHFTTQVFAPGQFDLTETQRRRDTEKDQSEGVNAATVATAAINFQGIGNRESLASLEQALLLSSTSGRSTDHVCRDRISGGQSASALIGVCCPPACLPDGNGDQHVAGPGEEHHGCESGKHCGIVVAGSKFAKHGSAGNHAEVQHHQ